MATTVGSILNQVRRKIIDEGGGDFEDSELITIYNNTNKKIVTLRPQAYTRIEPMALAPGNKQQIPSDGLATIGVLRNMGTDGQTPGRVIRPTDGPTMTTMVPTYATDTATEQVEDWWPILDYPEQFYIYPPNDGTGYVEVEMSKAPPQTVYDAGALWESEASPFNDNYLDAQINGMLFQAYDDDTDIPGNTPRSQLYYGRFLQALGVGGQQQ